MLSLIFRGYVDGGRFKPDDPVRWAGRLAQLEGKRVQFSVKREQTRRTISQNSYLWGVVYATLSEWSGHSPEEIHQHLKHKFLPAGPAKRLPDGEELVTEPSTAGLSVEEFAAYVNEVVRWAAEHGVYVPAAEEVTT